MPRSKAFSVASILAAALWWLNSDVRAFARYQDIPVSVVQMGQCYNSLDANLRIATGGTRQVPLLPDRFEEQTMVEVIARAGEAREAQPPPLPPSIGVNDLDREGLRLALSLREPSLESHLRHLETLHGQTLVLGEAAASAQRFERFAVSQLSSLAASSWPSWRDTTILNAWDEACSGTYMGQQVASTKVALAERYTAFAYGDELRIVEAVFAPFSSEVQAALPAFEIPSCYNGLTPIPGCFPDRRFVVRPYRLGDEGSQQRQRESLTSVVLEDFHGQAANAALALRAAQSRFAAAFGRDRESVDDAASWQSAALANERAGLISWRAEIDLEGIAVESLADRMRRLVVTVAALDQTIGDLAASIVTSADEAESHRRIEAEIRTQIAAAQAAVSDIRKRRDDLSLDCNGVSYEACTNPQAQAQYNETLFKLYAELGEAENALWTLRDRLDGAINARYLAQDQNAEFRLRRIEALTERAESRTTFLDVEAEWTARRDLLSIETETWTRSNDGNVRATNVANAILALRLPE
jgi:hypothetical protein